MMTTTKKNSNHKSHKPYKPGFKLGSLISLPHFGYEITEKLGGGSFGSVYKIHFNHDEQLNKLQWVIKEIPEYVTNLMEAIEEAKIQSRMRYTFVPFNSNKKIYIISEFIPGKTLEKYLRAHSKFEFTAAVQIIYQLAEQLYQAHHHTLRGKPFVHGDVCDRNIMLNLDKAKNWLNVTLFDNGLSSEHRSDDPNQLFNFERSRFTRLNKQDFPVEVLRQNQYGYKSDVYMLGSIAKAILIDDFPSDAVERLTMHFIERMQASNYHARPDIEEVLKFFLTLNKVHLYMQGKTVDTETEYELLAKLIVLSYDLWYEDVPFKDLKTPTFWSEFDFEHNHFITRIIVDLYQAFAHDKVLLQSLFENFPAQLPYYLNTYINNEAHRLSPTYLYWLTNEVLQQKGTVDINFLNKLQGTPAEKCKLAEKILCNILKHTDNIELLKHYLKLVSKVDYLRNHPALDKLRLFKGPALWRNLILDNDRILKLKDKVLEEIKDTRIKELIAMEEEITTISAIPNPHTKI